MGFQWMAQKAQGIPGMKIPLFQVDAFTEKIFSGNPAAVCPLTHWLEDKQMLAIAAENNVSETAFFVPENGAYCLRWFSPKSEVQLCGHATLAAAFVISIFSVPAQPRFVFTRVAGRWISRKKGTTSRWIFRRCLRVHVSQFPKLCSTD